MFTFKFVLRRPHGALCLGEQYNTTRDAVALLSSRFPVSTQHPAPASSLLSLISLSLSLSLCRLCPVRCALRC